MKTDIRERCVTINQVKPSGKGPPDGSRLCRNLHQRVADYTQSVEPDEQRLLSEVAIMADRLAIDEELTRLHTHMARLSVILEETQEPIGRKLDFLIQEINREINTIGSKVNDVGIAGMVVDIKEVRLKKFVSRCKYRIKAVSLSSKDRRQVLMTQKMKWIF